MWEVGLPPSSLKFSSHCHFQKLSCSCLLGGAAAPAGRHVCLQFTWEVGLPSSHNLPCSWLLGARPAPARGSPARPSLFIYSPGKGSLPPIFSAREPHPLSSVSLLFLLLITQFLFFSRVEVSLSRGLCCSGPGLSVGLPRYREAHLVRVFPSRMGAGHSWPWGPSLFLCLTSTHDVLICI
jgi:hypothetical protein